MRGAGTSRGINRQPAPLLRAATPVDTLDDRVRALERIYASGEEWIGRGSWRAERASFA